MYNLGIFRRDFSASIVVFFVALPLCLGIALASGAPLFSGIIAGKIKEEAIRQIEAEGPFEIEGDALMMKNLDLLLDSFCQDQRMKLPTEKEYLPCYRILP